MEDKIDLMLCKLRGYSIKYKWIIFIILLISVITYFYSFIQNDKDIQAIAEYYNQEYQLNNNNLESDEIIVHIDGAIVNPGVYSLKVGSRINDVVNLAGGFNDMANTKIVNLAKRLNDGEKIYIYMLNEEIVEDENVDKSRMININNGNKEELMSLPGIGESTANKIIEYRKNKRFNRIEDIKNVAGIGESKYNLIKDYINVK